MVCFYSLAIEAAIRKFHDDFYYTKSPVWNWLIYDISKFIFENSSEYKTSSTPNIPNNNNSDWGIWFNSVIEELTTEFNDATPELCLRILNNCPHGDHGEEVAIMIFCTINTDTVYEWIKTCPPRWTGDKLWKKRSVSKGAA
jgi:hypothetical protein